MGSPSSDGVVASPSCGQWLTSSGKQRLQAGHSFIYWPGTKRNDGKKDFPTANLQRWQSRSDSNGCGREQASNQQNAFQQCFEAVRHRQGYRTTTFTNRCGTTITLTTSCPSIKWRTFSSLRAALRSCSSVTSGEASSRERSLPLTWIGISSSSRRANFGSARGQRADFNSPPSWPSFCHISSAMCGEKGASINTKLSNASRTANTSDSSEVVGAASNALNSLNNSINAATMVFKCSPSKS